MSLTHYPHGVLATPNLGGTGRLMELFESDNIWFVDGDDGSASNDGDEPTKALALPSEAITKASAGASIYIKPRVVDQSSVSQNVFYTDDIVIPYDKSAIALIGCGQPQPHNYAGAGLRPSTATGTLLTIKSNSNLIENLYLTLNGGTADSASGTNSQAIILMKRVTTSGSESRTYGNVVRGCRFAEDKSHPTYAGAYLTSSIALGCAVHTVIEDNIFEDCLGGIVLQSVVGNQEDTHIRRNTFGGAVANRDCDIIVSINSANCNNICIYDNMFADGKPAHSGGASTRFINFIYVTIGTGILANNYFATSTVTNGFGESTGGTQALVAANFFMPGNYYEGTGTTAPYGLVTT